MQVGTHTPLIGATDAAAAQPASQQGGQDASFEAVMSDKAQTDTHADGTLPEGAEGGVLVSPLNTMSSAPPIRDSRFAAPSKARLPLGSKDVTGSLGTTFNEGAPTKESETLTSQSEVPAKNNPALTALVPPKVAMQSIPQHSSDPQNNTLSDGAGGGGAMTPSVDGHENSSLMTGGNAQSAKVQGAVSQIKSQALTGADPRPLAKTQMGTPAGADQVVVMSPSVEKGPLAGMPKQSTAVAGAANPDDLTSKGALEKHSTANPAMTPDPELGGKPLANTAAAPHLMAKALGQGDVTERPDKAIRHDARAEAADSLQTSVMVSHNNETATKTYFSNDLGTSITSKLALLQDASLQNSAPTPLDTIVSEQVFDLAMSDARAAETLTGRAEVSAHIRTELPRHVALQLADVAKTMPDRPVELTLSPEELGRLRLTFTGDLSAMTVSVNVERPETLDLMRRHIDMLAQEMRDIGYGEVTFSFEQSGAETGGQSADADSTDGGENPNSNPTGTSPDINPAPVRLSVTGASGVDIRL